MAKIDGIVSTILKYLSEDVSKSFGSDSVHEIFPEIDKNSLKDAINLILRADLLNIMPYEDGNDSLSSKPGTTAEYLDKYYVKITLQHLIENPTSELGITLLNDILPDLSADHIDRIFQSLTKKLNGVYNDHGKGAKTLGYNKNDVKDLLVRESSNLISNQHFPSMENHTALKTITEFLYKKHQEGITSIHPITIQQELFDYSIELGKIKYYCSEIATQNYLKKVEHSDGIEYLILDDIEEAHFSEIDNHRSGNTNITNNIGPNSSINQTIDSPQSTQSIREKDTKKNNTNKPSENSTAGKYSIIATIIAGILAIIAACIKWLA